MAKKKAPELASKPMSMDDHKYDDYSVQSAFDTLMRAEDHKSDPKMMDLIHKKMKKHKRVIKSIDDLKKARNDMAMNDNDEDD